MQHCLKLINQNVAVYEYYLNKEVNHQKKIKRDFRSCSKREGEAWECFHSKTLPAIYVCYDISMVSCQLLKKKPTSFCFF